MQIEKTVDIELADGTAKTVILRAILRSQRKILRKSVMPKEVSQNMEQADVKVEYEKLDDYQDMLVSFSVKSPPEYKDVKALGELPQTSFDKLLEAAQEINGEKNPGLIEKKSERPSSEASSAKK